MRGKFLIYSHFKSQAKEFHAKKINEDLNLVLKKSLRALQILLAMQHNASRHKRYFRKLTCPDQSALAVLFLTVDFFPSSSFALSSSISSSLPESLDKFSSSSSAGCPKGSPG